jgi:hypothetical protein
MFTLRLSQTNFYDISCFSATHPAVISKNRDRFYESQDSVSVCSVRVRIVCQRVALVRIVCQRVPLVRIVCQRVALVRIVCQCVALVRIVCQCVALVRIVCQCVALESG